MKELIAIGSAFAFIGTTLAAWVTHVIVCIQAQAWFLLLIGGLIAPVGMIHGVMVWLGMGAV